MASPLRLIAAVFLGASLCVSATLAAGYQVTVAASDVDRAAQVVVFTPPAANAKSSGVLRGANGAVLPLQADAEGKLRFVIPAQKAGEELTFRFAEEKPEATRGVQVKDAKGHLDFAINGKPALAYQMDKEALPRPDIKPEYKRAGYLHPIQTPTGTIVSDDYPVQHVHHHGIWSPWTKTSFQGRTPDFWNMGQKSGTVEFVALDRSWSGPVSGGFVARHKFVDLSAPSPVVALHETWEVTAYTATPDATVFDLVLTQTCATSDPLILPKYHYGGLGFRGRGEWFGETKANFFSSVGDDTRVNLNGKPMKWVHVSGLVENGATAGLAVLGHPDNFRAPQPVRVHPKEPYVSFTPSFESEWRIEPGKPYVARYRFVAADGKPDRARLDAFWNGYARAAEVRVQPLP